MPALRAAPNWSECDASTQIWAGAEPQLQWSYCRLTSLPGRSALTARFAVSFCAGTSSTASLSVSCGFEAFAS